ncbi:hypothetical protein F4802DRAFT_611473, partial [Xylaria palmicola]
LLRPIIYDTEITYIYPVKGSERPPRIVQSSFKMEKVEEVFFEVMSNAYPCITVYIEGNQAQQFANVPFQVWRLWAQNQSPTSSFIVLDRSHQTALESEDLIKAQAGPDVEVKYEHSARDDVPDDVSNANRIAIRHLPEFLLQECDREPREGQTIIVVVLNMRPSRTSWDNILLAGLHAWMQKTRVKSSVRCFITTDKSAPNFLPGQHATVQLPTVAEPTIQEVLFREGTVTTRVASTVRYIVQVFEKHPTARVAIIADGTTKAMVVHRLAMEREKATPQSHRGRRQEGLGGQGSQPSPLPFESPINTIDDLRMAQRAVNEERGPLLYVLDVAMELLVGHHLDLHCLAVFEPIQTVRQYPNPTLSVHVMHLPLSPAGISVCRDVLGNSPDGTQQSLLRCMATNRVYEEWTLEPHDLPGMLFLAIGLGVESPLSSGIITPANCVRQPVLIHLQRLIDRGVIVEIYGKFKLADNLACDVFAYMVSRQLTDLNHSWLFINNEYVSMENENLESLLAVWYLISILDPIERFGRITSNRPGDDIDAVVCAATDKLPEYLCDWEDKGSMWYIILLWHIIARDNICLDPESPVFTPKLEIAKGLVVDAERLGRIQQRVAEMQGKNGIGGPLFNPQRGLFTKNDVDIAYLAFVRKVVQAYPRQMVWLFAANNTAKYAQYAYEPSTTTKYSVNDQTFDRVLLRRCPGGLTNKPTLAVYFTRVSNEPVTRGISIENMLIVPDAIADELVSAKAV